MNKQSIWNKMSDEQFERINDHYGWRVSASLLKESTLKQQTETFWLLQLQFMSMKRNALSGIAFYYIELNPNYKRNKHTKKIRDIYKSPSWDITDEQHACLATHLALQLAGIEE